MEGILASIFLGVGLFFYAGIMGIFMVLFLFLRKSDFVRERIWLQALILLGIVMWPITWIGLVLGILGAAVFFLFNILRAMNQVEAASTKSSVKQLRS